MVFHHSGMCSVESNVLPSGCEEITTKRYDMAAVHEKDERSYKTRACIVQIAHRQGLGGMLTSSN